MYTTVSQNLSEYTKEQIEEKFKIIFTVTIPYLESMLFRNAEDDTAGAYKLINWALDTYLGAMSDAVRLSKHHHEVYYGRERDGVNGMFCKFIAPYDVDSDFFRHRCMFSNFDNIPITWNSKKKWASHGFRIGRDREPSLLRREFIDRRVTNVGNVRYWTGGHYMYYGVYSLLDVVPANGSRAKDKRDLFIKEVNQRVISLSDGFGGKLPF